MTAISSAAAMPLPRWLSFLILPALLSTATAAAKEKIIGTYLPLSYMIPPNSYECLYERIAERDEHVTASVFVLEGDNLKCAVVLEGPVAPVDLDLNNVKKGKHSSTGGAELQSYLSRYEKEGTKMFTKGKWGDSMLNVQPIRITELIDFEEEEEDFMDDYYMTDKEREQFNKEHDMEHRHFEHEQPPPPRHLERGQGQRKIVGRNAGEAMGMEAEEQGEPEYFDDDYVRAREEMRLEDLRRETEMDDDFVKLQLDHARHEEELGGGPQRRRINKDGVEEPEKGAHEGSHLISEDKKNVEEPKGNFLEPPKGEEKQNHRRLKEEPMDIKLLAGEPYQKTIQVESPGWYRFCVHPTGHEIEVEMELRKSSLYGRIDARTGHVPSLEGVEIHSEIRELYEGEDDTLILAEEGAIKTEDLTATKEQLRILERLYGDIITKQLEERRTWNWRTIKNQHLYSHLVLGNLVETIVYMGITGWQVYTIRKWFGGGPALGR